MQKEAVVLSQGDRSKIFFEKRMSNILEFRKMGLDSIKSAFAFNILIAEEISPTAEDIDIILQYAKKNRRIKESDLEYKRGSVKNGNSLTDEEKDEVLKLVITREIITVEKVKKPQGKDEWEVAVASRNIDQPLAVVKKLLNRKASWSYATQIAKLEDNPTKDPIVGFAQELAALDGMIPNTDLSKYTQLVGIIVQSDIKLPNKACLIVLEAFLNAQQNSGLLNKYKELRNEFFNKETGDVGASKELQMLNLEDFIGEKVNKKSTDGTKSYNLLGVDENGNPVFDNVLLSRQRQRSREIIATEAVS